MLCWLSHVEPRSFASLRLVARTRAELRKDVRSVLTIHSTEQGRSSGADYGASFCVEKKTERARERARETELHMFSHVFALFCPGGQSEQVISLEGEAFNMFDKLFAASQTVRHQPSI